LLLDDGTHVFLEDDLLGARRTHDLCQPAQMGGIPVGPAFVADVLPEQERFEPLQLLLPIAIRFDW
jgi:hypothetical protein